MRMVLSDEASGTRGSYRSLSEVLAKLPGLAATSEADGSTATLKGYRLRLTLSEDKKRFQVALTPQTGCRTSWFGSETNLIYVGQPLGCATK